MTDLLTKYLQLTGSTTRFLETVNQVAVRAQIHSQERCMQTNTLERLSTLHVGGSGAVLAATCNLNLASLTEAEAQRLTETTEPIGAILLSTMDEDLRREALKIESVDQHPLSELLKIDAGPFFTKTFELWQGDRFIGDLVEVVCRQSIDRMKGAGALSPMEREIR